MEDAAVAIDLEWRPDIGPPHNKVALIQLASCRHCLLIRLCQLSCKNPPPLMEFLRDPSIHLIGYSWDGCDEDKLILTMGIGKAYFGGFLDVQVISENLGYKDYGLASMAERIFGTVMPKSREVTMSNWAAEVLTTSQITYAALDALVCGHLLRCFRSWHALPFPCQACRYLMGSVVQYEFTCRTRSCRCKFRSFKCLKKHVKATKHEPGPNVYRCNACGRMALPGPDPQMALSGSEP